MRRDERQKKVLRGSGLPSTLSQEQYPGWLARSRVPEDVLRVAWLSEALQGAAKHSLDPPNDPPWPQREKGQTHAEVRFLVSSDGHALELLFLFRQGRSRRALRCSHLDWSVWTVTIILYNHITHFNTRS